MLRIQILVDNPRSWILPYVKILNQELTNLGHQVKLVHNSYEVKQGDILCLLACERIFKRLELNKHNLVVHESDLPSGKGWSPVSWQILEGKTKIPVTLLEANEKVDAGRIYAQKEIILEGHELWPEIKHQQGSLTISLILDFIQNYPIIVGVSQKGEESFYQKRTPDDSELDLNKTLDDQFNLLRICDNERYPAYFLKNGFKYIIKIYKEDNLDQF